MSTTSCNRVLLGAGQGAHLRAEGSERYGVLACPWLSSLSTCPVSCRRADLTDGISTDPPHSSRGGAREKRPLESSPEPYNVDRARAPRSKTGTRILRAEMDPNFG